MLNICVINAELCNKNINMGVDLSSTCAHPFARPVKYVELLSYLHCTVPVFFFRFIEFCVGEAKLKYIPTCRPSYRKLIAARYSLQMTSSKLVCDVKTMTLKMARLLGVFAFEKITEKLFFHYVHSYVTKKIY